MRIWSTFIIAGGYSLLLNAQIIRSGDFEQVEYFKILSPAKFLEVDDFGHL